MWVDKIIKKIKLMVNNHERVSYSRMRAGNETTEE